MPQAYSVREKKKVEMRNISAHKTTTRGGVRYMLKGESPAGHKVTLFVKKEEYDKYK